MIINARINVITKSIICKL